MYKILILVFLSSSLSASTLKPTEYELQVIQRARFRGFTFTWSASPESKSTFTGYKKIFELYNLNKNGRPINIGVAGPRAASLRSSQINYYCEQVFGSSSNRTNGLSYKIVGSSDRAKAYNLEVLSCVVHTRNPTE